MTSNKTSIGGATHHETDRSGPAAEQAAQFDPMFIRRAMGHFASGVTIVTGVVDGVPAGFTCQSFFSLSLDPPLIAIAPAVLSRSYAAIRSAKHFCVNMLASDQSDLCFRFGGGAGNKFGGIDWNPTESGCPILPGVLAWIDCSIDAEVAAGDHWLVIGRVRDFGHRDADPLVYFRGQCQDLARVHTAP